MFNDRRVIQLQMSHSCSPPCATVTAIRGAEGAVGVAGLNRASSSTSAGGTGYSNNGRYLLERFGHLGNLKVVKSYQIVEELQNV